MNAKFAKLFSKSEDRKKDVIWITFSIRQTVKLAKHGKHGTSGFRVTRGAKDICGSNT